MVVDIINALLTLWIKPMLVLALMMYVVSKPDFRSAATNHWLLFLAVLSPLLCLLFFALLPRIDFGILPKNIAAFTETEIFSYTSGPLAHPNLLTLLILSLYLSGLCRCLYQLLRALWQTRSLTRRASAISTRNIIAMKNRLQRDFSLKRNVELLCSRDLQAPIVWGMLQPQVILPMHARNWSEPRLRRVLAHEFAHIARGDWLLKLLGHILCAFFWFNPLVWRTAKACAWQAELACDDLVINKLHCRAEYAGDLFELATDASHHSVATLAFIKKSELYLRINAILDGGKNRHAPDIWLKTLISVLVLALLLPISVLQAKQSPWYELRARIPDRPVAIEVRELGELASNYDDVLEGPGVTHDYLPLEEIKRRYGNMRELELVEVSQIENRFAKLATLEVPASNGLNSRLRPNTDIQLASVDVEPLKPLKIVTPGYPKRALQRNLEATVIVALDVDIDGRVRNPRIISSDHSRIFHSTVLKAVKDFQYQPMTVNGRPIITRNVEETFVFTLKDTTDT